MNLKTKLIITILIIVILSTAAGMAIAVKSTKSSFNEYISSHAAINQVQWEQYIAAYYRQYQDLQGLQNDLPAPRMTMGNRGMQRGFAFTEHVIVIDRDGKIVYDNQSNLLGQKADSKLISEGRPVSVDGEEIGTVIIRVIPPKGAGNLEERFFASVYIGFFWGGLMACLLAVILGYIMSAGLVRPIQRLTQAVAQFTSNNWQYRAEVSTNDEIGSLSKAFNSMAEQLEKSIKLKRQLVADVSHELRTPITILRGNLESIQAGVKEASPQLILSMNDEVLRLSRLITELQELSLVDNNNLPINKQRIDMVVLLEKIHQIFLAEAEGKGVQLNLEITKSPFFLYIDEDKITQVILNLVSNSLRHTPPETDVGICLDEEIIRGVPYAVLKVFDQGPGIPENEAENIFERFYRIDEARNREQGGMGLGLAIAKGIVEAHGGKIWVADNGQLGAVFTVQLPIQ